MKENKLTFFWKVILLNISIWLFLIANAKAYAICGSRTIAPEESCHPDNCPPPSRTSVPLDGWPPENCPHHTVYPENNCPHSSKFPKKSYEWTEENNALSASTTIILPKVIFQDCNLGVRVNSFHIFFKDFSYILHNTFYKRTPLSK